MPSAATQSHKWNVLPSSLSSKACHPASSHLAMQPNLMLGSCASVCRVCSTACSPTCSRMLPAVCVQGGLGSSKQQLDALLAVRCGYPRAAQAAQALAGFACASLKEDRFGVLQLTQVGLAVAA